jgi:hypothetical protein
VSGHACGSACGQLHCTVLVAGYWSLGNGPDREGARAAPAQRNAAVIRLKGPGKKPETVWEAELSNPKPAAVSSAASRSSTARSGRAANGG